MSKSEAAALINTYKTDFDKEVPEQDSDKIYTKTNPTASGNHIDKYVIFPQQVMGLVENKLRKDQAKMDSKIIDVTVFVAPGDYFLFSCFNKFVEHYACV